MFNLASLYKPLTAQALKFVSCLPCDSLKPFIADYWGTADVFQTKANNQPVFVIPDACMDVIFTVNHTAGTVSGQLCGMGETANTFVPVVTADVISTFSIRFYFWSIHFFADHHLRDTMVSYNDAFLYFKGWKPFFTEMLLGTFSLRERSEKTDRFLLSKLDESKHNHHIMNALYHVMKRRGASSVPEACAYACVSQRQLERLFMEHIGTTVKKTLNLVRYQNLWRDIVFQENFDVQDAVLKYGFTDQAHLINSFRYHHSMSPLEALQAIRLHV